MAKRELININIRVPKTLKELVQEYVQADLHTNLSEFARDSLREKIQRDAPDLYRKLFSEIR